MDRTGFTLLELIIIIVILGIVSVAVTSKFHDISGEAARATADGVFSAAQMAASRNFARNLMGSGSYNITSCTTLLQAIKDLSHESPDQNGWSCSGAKELSKTIKSTKYAIRITSDENSTSKAGLCCTWTSQACPPCP